MSAVQIELPEAVHQKASQLARESAMPLEELMVVALSPDPSPSMAGRGRLQHKARETQGAEMGAGVEQSRLHRL